MSIPATTAAKTKKGNPRGSGYQRAERDLYVEPEWAVEALIRAEPNLPEPIWDPACGTGTIPRVFRRHGFVAYGTDIADGHDFLVFDEDTIGQPFGSIVCNPPYKHAQAFVERALSLDVDVSAFLLRLAFLEGQKRRKLFEGTSLSRVLVFSRRVSCPPPDHLINGRKHGGGAIAYAWFVWRRGHSGPPTIGWLP
jgi:hypothetical protein